MIAWPTPPPWQPGSTAMASTPKDRGATAVGSSDSAPVVRRRSSRSARKSRLMRSRRSRALGWRIAWPSRNRHSRFTNPNGGAAEHPTEEEAHQPAVGAGADGGQVVRSLELPEVATAHPFEALTAELALGERHDVQPSHVVEVRRRELVELEVVSGPGALLEVGHLTTVPDGLRSLPWEADTGGTGQPGGPVQPAASAVPSSRNCSSQRARTEGHVEAAAIDRAPVDRAAKRPGSSTSGQDGGGHLRGVAGLDQHAVGAVGEQRGDPAHPHGHRHQPRGGRLEDADRGVVDPVRVHEYVVGGEGRRLPCRVEVAGERDAVLEPELARPCTGGVEQAVVAAGHRHRRVRARLGDQPEHLDGGERVVPRARRSAST